MAHGEAPEIRELEIEVARHRTVQHEMDRILQAHGGVTGQVQGKLHDLAARINPLVEEDRGVVRKINLCGKIGMGAGLTALVGATGSGLLGPYSLGVAGIGAAALVGSFLIRTSALRRHQDINARYEALNRN